MLKHQLLNLRKIMAIADTKAFRNILKIRADI